VSDVWTTIVVLCGATALIRASGPVLFGGRSLPGPLRAVIPMLAPALLAALVITETLAGLDGFDVDERAAGVGTAAILLMRRPDAVLPAIAVAAVVTAALRAVV
jgi:branched-subunit amino acid transport protein